MRAWQSAKVSSTDPAAVRSLFLVGATDDPIEAAGDFFGAADDPAEAADDSVGAADDSVGAADEPVGVADEPIDISSLAQPATIIPSKTTTPTALKD